jgi:hypothetical protein
MFKSIEFITNEEYKSIYKIIDDDFEEIVKVGLEKETRYIVLRGLAVVQTYKNKNLNVSKNLLLYIKYIYIDARPNTLTINEIISVLSEFDFYEPYKEDINRYLLLL